MHVRQPSLCVYVCACVCEKIFHNVTQILSNHLSFSCFLPFTIQIYIKFFIFSHSKGFNWQSFFTIFRFFSFFFFCKHTYTKQVNRHCVCIPMYEKKGGKFSHTQNSHFLAAAHFGGQKFFLGSFSRTRIHQHTANSSSFT